MRILAIVFLLSFGFLGQAQNLDPVKWKAELVLVEEGNYELRFTADIENKWVIYSQHVGNEGPIPTTFSIDKKDTYKLIGAVEEPDNPIVEHDEMFDMKLIKFKGPASFVQKVQSSQQIQSISGSIEFMTCDSKRCLPPKIVEFTATLKG